MQTIANTAEFRLYTACQQEFAAAARKDDTNAARLAFAEIEGIWLHTAWPRLRNACGAFLVRNAQFSDFEELAV